MLEEIYNISAEPLLRPGVFGSFSGPLLGTHSTQYSGFLVEGQKKIIALNVRRRKVSFLPFR